MMETFARFGAPVIGTVIAMASAALGFMQGWYIMIAYLLLLVVIRLEEK